MTETTKQTEILKVLERWLSTVFDYWSEPNEQNKWTHVMVKPEAKKHFESFLKSYEITFSVLIEDVGALVRKQLILNENEGTDADFDYSKYHRLDEINHWMNDIEAAYPKYVTLFNVSRSYQGRDIYAMKISIPNASKKPALWFDGGIHAREWLKIV